MKKQYIVRADFYPDGTILPLGLTDKSGNTKYIDRVKKIISKTYVDNLLEYKFTCVSNNKEIVLIFKNNIWECIESI